MSWIHTLTIQLPETSVVIIIIIRWRKDLPKIGVACSSRGWDVKLPKPLEPLNSMVEGFDTDSQEMRSSLLLSAQYS